MGPVILGLGRDDPLAAEGGVDAVHQGALAVGRETALTAGVEPDDVAGIHPRLPHLVLDVPADTVIHQGGEHRGPEAKTVGKPLGNVGLTTSVPDAADAGPFEGDIDGVEA